MMTRRWIGCALALALAGHAAHAASLAAVPTAEMQSSIDPAEAVGRLRAGNDRFVAGTPLQREDAMRVRLTSTGQYPFAAVLGCIDSRVPPEVVFDAGIGDIFVARIAGNVLDDDLLGSLEFATKVAGAKAIVVLAHTQCGAVKGACDGVRLGHLTQTLAHLAPAVTAAKGEVASPHDGSNPAFVGRVTELNAKLTAAAMLERSPILRALVDEGKLVIVPAVYDLSTGRVAFL